MHVLIEAGSIKPEEIEEMEYDEVKDEILIGTKTGSHVYKIEESIETYIINHEVPLYTNNIAKEVRK